MTFFFKKNFPRVSLRVFSYHQLIQYKAGFIKNGPRKSQNQQKPWQAVFFHERPSQCARKERRPVRSALCRSLSASPYHMAHIHMETLPKSELALRATFFSKCYARELKCKEGRGLTTITYERTMHSDLLRETTSMSFRILLASYNDSSC